MFYGRVKQYRSLDFYSSQRANVADLNKQNKWKASGRLLHRLDERGVAMLHASRARSKQGKSHCHKVFDTPQTIEERRGVSSSSFSENAVLQGAFGCQSTALSVETPDVASGKRRASGYLLEN